MTVGCFGRFSVILLVWLIGVMMTGDEMKM
jgi:hypothetical protein